MIQLSCTTAPLPANAAQLRPATAPVSCATLAMSADAAPLQVEGDESELSRWVDAQRRQNSSGELQAERKSKLDSLGFVWTPEDISEIKWREMYEQLKSYQAQNGDADVLSRWKTNPKLAAWVSHQRERKKQGVLPADQMRLLDELSFTWQSRERGTWEDRLAMVVKFKERNGHCNIPVSDPELGGFVNTMRVQKRNGLLSAERITKLDAVGFVWVGTRKMTDDGLSEMWKRRCDELLRYKETHGDCNVPVEWPENPQLGRWVSQQRQQQKNGKLHPERQRKLNEMGFAWEFSRGKRSVGNSMQTHN